MEEKKKTFQEIDVNELIDGDPIFESHGISKIKVTKDKEVKILTLKIRSTGVADLVDAFSKTAPVPPVAKILVEPGSNMAKQMGINKKQWIRMPDFADPNYISKKAKHDEALGMAVMLQGLDVTFKGKDGKLIEDPEEKVSMMKRQGMTGSQFMQIVEDIQALTSWAEEETTDFFDEV